MKRFHLIALFALALVQPLGAQTNPNPAADIPAAAVTNTPAALPKPPRGPTVIRSDTWSISQTSHEMIYQGHVHVDDPDMKLISEWLAANLPEGGGHVSQIVAATNVVIDFADEKGRTNHATCDQAVYAYEVKGGVTNETVTLTGNAKVENAQGWLTGEPIWFDKANNSLHAHANNPTMILRQNFNGAPADTNPPPATLTGTNSQVPPGTAEKTGESSP